MGAQAHKQVKQALDTTERPLKMNFYTLKKDSLCGKQVLGFENREKELIRKETHRLNNSENDDFVTLIIFLIF